jgi:hypothetical protein
VSNEPPRKLIGPPAVRNGSKLTPDLCDRICTGVAKGLFPKEAAKLAGVHAKTFESWLKKGAQRIEPFATLVAAIEQSEAALEAHLTAAFLAGSGESWQAARDLLERRFPDRWSRDEEERRAQFGLAFSININLGPTIEEGAWEREVNRRRMAALPTVSEADAKAIELETPATKV